MPKSPQMFQHYLMKRLGQPTYEALESMMDTFSVVGEREESQIMGLIGEVNRECLQVIRYLKCSSTPNNSSSPISQTSTRPSNKKR